MNEKFQISSCISIILLFILILANSNVATISSELDSDINSKPNLPESCKTEYNHRYAVLLEGTYYGYPSLYYEWLGSIQRMYWTLTVKHGFEEEDIYVLSSPRDFEEPPFWDPSIIDYPSTKADLEMVLTNLKNIMTEDDLLVFCPLSFGTGDQFTTRYERVYLSELATWVNGTLGQLMFIFEQPWSNTFIDDLSKDNRIIGTSTNPHQPVEDWIQQFIMGLIGFADMDLEIGNQDGNVSFEEAHHYVARFVGIWRWSHLDDNGDGVGHHYTDEGYNISDPSKDAYHAYRTFLEGTTTSTPPEAPDGPFGPTTGIPGFQLGFSVNGTDPESDPMVYGWDWDGDLEVDQWTELYDSGRNVSIGHIWSEFGIYEIRVKAKDIHGYDSIWSDPLVINITENHAPTIPDINGPLYGKYGVEYTYSAESTDPDGNQLYYLFDWGDGNHSDWIGPLDSGEICETNYTWKENASFEVKVKAKDIYGNESNWSEPLIVTIESIPPRIEIIKPINSLYFLNLKLWPRATPLIIGKIDIEVISFDNLSGVHYVEFYIDDDYKSNISVRPFTWTWDERAFFKHTIKVIAYDYSGNNAINETIVWKFF